MNESTSKEKVLKKVRNALIHESPNPHSDVEQDTNIYPTSEDPEEIVFAEAFTAANGMFIFCEDFNDFAENVHALASQRQWNNFICKEPQIREILAKSGVPHTDKDADLPKVNASITSCECLIARTGSIMFSSKQASGRKLISYPEAHIVVGFTSQLVPDIKDALTFMKSKYSDRLPSMMTIVTGPSRFNSIETTMVIGADGPKELYLFLIDNSLQ